MGRGGEAAAQIVRRLKILQSINGVKPEHQVKTLHGLAARALADDGVDSHRLVDLCDRYGIDHPNAHDALADARATATLLPHLLRAAGTTDLGSLDGAVRGVTTAWPTPTVVGRSWWRRTLLGQR